jgi:8-oxo-dGTP pyrophosphatase MutT (NUDIX family)
VTADPFPIEVVDRIDYRFAPRDWPFAATEAGAIDAHWARLRAEKPALFNGRVFLLHRAEVVAEGGLRVLRAACLEAEFKAFIAWRDFGCPDPTVKNCFAMAALRSADGAFMLGRMGAHTANAGKVYFPSGTPDPTDLAGTHVDLEGSVRRELAEETGITEATFEPGWTLVHAGPRLACMKMARSPLPAAALAARFAAFQASDPHPELTALEPVFGAADIDAAATLDFVTAYLRHAWNKAG